MRPIEEQGYIIPAWNTGKIDYVDCARALAKTILRHHPQARICLLTNQKNAADQNLFAYTHVVENIDTQNPWANDWLVFEHTPFRETIKLEADMVAATPIDHWWTMFRARDVVISQGCRTIYNKPSTYRGHRKIFDANNLPDVYNAVTYWRLSATAKEFFNLVQSIFENWESYSKTIKFPEITPSTDVVYAMAAQIMGPERVTLPRGYGPNIVHMKSGHQPIQGLDWTKELVWESDPMRINTVAQWGLVHFHNKDWQA